uniref:Uncharacterized protein n=1 Tax=Ditylenchus dipsaci TaxID=166011 RepID=A0A915DBN2_9BILA
MPPACLGALCHVSLWSKQANISLLELLKEWIIVRGLVLGAQLVAPAILVLALYMCSIFALSILLYLSIIVLSCACTIIYFHGISDGREWTSTASLVDSGGLLRHLSLTQVDFYGISGGLGELLRHLCWTSTAFQVEFYSVSGGLIWHLRWIFMLLQVDCYGVLGGIFYRLRWTSTASQVEFLSGSDRSKWTSAVTEVGFHGISGGFLFQLCWTSRPVQVDIDGIIGGLTWRLWWTFTASVIFFYGDPGRLLYQFRWTSTASLEDFYGISGGRLRHLRWSSSATQVDLYGISGRLLWYVRWTSATSHVGLYGDSGGRLWHFWWTQVNFYFISGGIRSSAVMTHVGFHGIPGGHRLALVDFHVIFGGRMCPSTACLVDSSRPTRHLKWSSTASEVDINSITGGLLRLFWLTSTASLMDSGGLLGYSGELWQWSLLYLRCTSAASQYGRWPSMASWVDFCGISGGLLQRLRWKWAFTAFRMDFYFNSGHFSGPFS